MCESIPETTPCGFCKGNNMIVETYLNFDRRRRNATLCEFCGRAPEPTMDW